MKLLRIIRLCFNIISQLTIRYFEFVSYGTRVGLEWNNTYLYVNFKKSYSLVRQEALFNFLT